MNSSSTNRPLAIVTGASGGIGYELARRFAENGFDLLIAARGQEGLAEAARDLEASGAEVESLPVDLISYDGVEELYQKIESTGRSVDAVAINAGVGLGGEFARETALEDELDLIALNVTSTVHLAKRVVRDMVERGGGRVLFNASISGTRPTPFEAVYGASKAFVLSFAEALRNELKGTGVTVTALLPGPTQTDFFRRGDMGDTAVGAGEKEDPAEVARQGFEALMNGEGQVVGGPAKTKLQATANKVLPEGVKAEQHRRIAEPGSADG